jgi:hypothetical protein
MTEKATADPRRSANETEEATERRVVHRPLPDPEERFLI